jgi:FlaA1/EpsC-like NDP-sugar epimerase
LHKQFGNDCVIGTDVSKNEGAKMPCKLMILDIKHKKKMEKIIHDNKVTDIIHYAAILSATGETMPEKAMQVNIKGLENIFDVAIKHGCA